MSKLSDSLDTLYYEPTLSVTPRADEYRYEVIFQNRTMYEIGHHVSGEMPCTIILVDTAETGSSWTPNGLYELGKSNYEVTYCCDAIAPVIQGSHYKCLNLEDSGYYGEAAAEHIRAIIENSYPYLSIEEMKEGLIAGGLDSDFVSSLTRGDIISAVQMAVWAYSNSDADGMSEYMGTIEMTNNSVFRNPIHDYTNEIWSWWNTKKSTGGIYDAKAAYRVNTLVYYLCGLQGTPARPGQVVISDVQVSRAELIEGTDDVYSIGMYAYVNAPEGENDELVLTASSYTENADGTVTESYTVSYDMDEKEKYEIFVNAKVGDTVSVTVEGTQRLDRGVYFYEPEGGNEASQCLVGMFEGETSVKVERSFLFVDDIEKGLRIYKMDGSSGLPLSDITFTVYGTELTEIDPDDPAPTQEELLRYAVEENKVGAVTTDDAGYALLALEDGIYLVVEEFNEEKVKAPVEPFYIVVPMPQEKVTEGENGTVTEITYTDVVSVYPKNETVEPPEEPPELPPVPDNVTGSFSVLKHKAGDESVLLEGASFQVFRPATAEDTESVIITCDGVDYAAVPVTVDGEPLVLTTDENGYARSPAMTCGAYFIVETEAPWGYVLNENGICVTVYSDALDKEVTVKVPNVPGSILPETGGIGVFWLQGCGVLLIAAAITLLTVKSVKRRRNF